MRLDDSSNLHRFLSDFRDLVSWIHDMKTVISADELAKDVAGAEALLERHQEHKGEIDAREDSFRATAESGQQLLENNHYASDEVKEKVYHVFRSIFYVFEIECREDLIKIIARKIMWNFLLRMYQSRTAWTKKFAVHHPFNTNSFES